MTLRPNRLVVVAACALLFAPGSALAQAATDRGKKKLPQLFAQAAAPATAGTVRVQCDEKDAALGTVVTPDGYILTKGSELRGKIACLLPDGRLLTAEYVGYHKPSDLALLKVDAADLKPVTFARAADAEVGNWVAVTRPGEDPVAVGVVSARARKLYREESFIENHNKGYLGILGLTDTDDQEGVSVQTVDPAGAAAKAGFKSKDVIFEVAGKKVKNRDELLAAMEKYRAGETVRFGVRRGDDEIQIDVKLGSKGEVDRGAFQNGMGGALSGRRTGFPMVIQHDTVVKPNECGGPLVDLEGRVLGINIARAGRVETWTLPGDEIEPILKDLRTGKYAPLPGK